MRSADYQKVLLEKIGSVLFSSKEQNRFKSHFAFNVSWYQVFFIKSANPMKHSIAGRCTSRMQN